MSRTPNFPSTSPSTRRVFLLSLTGLLTLNACASRVIAGPVVTPETAQKIAVVESRRKTSLGNLNRLDSRRAILAAIPLLIADARKPINQKPNADRLAADLQFFSKALVLDENEIAAAQIENISAQLVPEKIEYKALLADYLARAGHAAEAGKIFSSVMLTKDTDPMMLKMLAQNKVRSGDPNGGRLLMEQFANRADNKTDPWYQSIRARTWLRSGFSKKAALLIHNAASIADTDYCREIWEASASNLDNKQKETGEHLLAAGRSLPDDPLWHADLSAWYSGTDVNKSRDEVMAALTSKRVYSRAFSANANYLISHGQYKQAESCLNYLAQLRPNSAELRFNKARLAKAEANLPEAISQYQTGLQLNPHASQSYIELAALFSETKQPEKARATLKQVTEECPNFVQGWLRYGDSLANQKLTEQAKATYLHALTLVPDIVEQQNVISRNEAGTLHARLASILYSAGDRAQAVAEAAIFNHFKLILDLPPALKMIDLRPGRLTETVTLKKEIQVRECVLLADALFECRDFKDATDEYRKAIALNGEDPNLHSFLMNALTESGDWSAAAGEDFHLSDSLVRKMPQNIDNFFHPKTKG